MAVTLLTYTSSLICVIPQAQPNRCGYASTLYLTKNQRFHREDFLAARRIRLDWSQDQTALTICIAAIFN